jgi:hydrocephalus-inducing protein
MTRGFVVEFYAYRENMTVQATVIFKNEDTQEYIQYELSFRTTSPGVLDTVQLCAAVRTRVIHKVTLRNPLSHTVTFNMTCFELGAQSGQRNVQCTDIRGPSQIKVAGRSADSFEFEFLPLFAREKQAQLTLSSAELGTNTYILSLVSTEAALCPLEKFTTPLGATETRTIKILNLAPSRGERAKYKIQISGDEFKTKVAGDFVSPGNDNIVKVPIVFEPAQLGVTRAVLTLSSSTGGQFDTPLVGECLNPVPAGPFSIKSGGRASIPFKNVQDTASKYVYTVSSDQFSTKDSEDWKPKEEKDIIVKYEGNKDPTIRSARLLVRCTSGLCAGVEWNFYLKGIP